MRKNWNYATVSLIPIFIWIGFVCSISFMEAWLKFRAPNVSLPIGLGIGKLIFAALNKVEWTLGAIAAATLFLDRCVAKWAKLVFLSAPLAMLAVQTSWLLPALNERADKIIQDIAPPPSSIHFYYIFSDLVKIALLFTLGIYIMRQLAQAANSHFLPKQRSPASPSPGIM